MASAGSATTEFTTVAGKTPGAAPGKRVLLISNRVMHYRVSVYNYFWEHFRQHGWDFTVLSNQMQGENPHECKFDFIKLPFDFFKYRAEIKRLKPDAVILFLHMKDRILWPLIHWLKLSGIPVAIWTKTRNLDDVDNRLRNMFFDYLHNISDGLVLYTASLDRFISKRNRKKIFVANNTINFEDFPEIHESKEEIKRNLGIPFEKVVLFVGRIGEEQNRKKVDHLIDMFRDLNRPGLGLVIVGSGLSDELRARINPVNTLYLGEVYDPEHRQISRIFKMADVCSIPGHVGLGLNQGFFWGLPMVTEQGKQPPEIEYLIDGENGFIVAEDDRRALQERILFLLDNDEQRRKMSDNARRYILEHASIDGMFQGFLSCAQYLTR
ncbi:MAG TPA: glycosyltransferase family 4 protein [Terriglobales bacterium]|nr:glycosyltransferase family 4 protein [Terriglobales bacterium]